MAELKGYAQLQARLHAIGGRGNGALMRQLGLQAVREQKLLVRRKTGQTGRTIHIAAVTPTSVTTVAGGAAVYLEHGTRPHEITPRAARALRFAASPAGRRLSGAPRVGAAVVFAKRVHHPGSKPYPFMIPGAKLAIRKTGVGTIVDTWNKAA